MTLAVAFDIIFCQQGRGEAVYYYFFLNSLLNVIILIKILSLNFSTPSR